MLQESKHPMWLRLDNAAKIFPASMRRGWSNVFRLSVSFRDPIDKDAMQRAVKRVSKRFPSICVRLGNGLFWYYLEQGKTPPALSEEGCQPLLPMTKKEMKRASLRILLYETRLAVEFFHALTDGTGALVFLKTLAATYLEEKEQFPISLEKGILSPDGPADPEEWEDAFLRYAGKDAAARTSSPAFRLDGIPEKDGFLHVSCGSIPTDQLLAVSRGKGVSMTAFLASCLIFSIAQIQQKKIPPNKQKAVRVQIPVNLRNFFPSKTLRNFVAVVNVGLEKGELDASFDEILSRVHHQMALFITKRNLNSVFTANVNSEKGLGIRLVPRILKDLVMRSVFDRVGESSACLCLSNLGEVLIPEAMESRIERFDFIIGPQAKAPYNCGVVSHQNTVRIHLVRNTREPELERVLFPLLSSFGLPLTLESNER